MSTRYTIEFMGLWEKMHNPNFNLTNNNDKRGKQAFKMMYVGFFALLICSVLLF